MQLPAWALRVAVATALVALVVWSFAARWAVLDGSPYPLGVDGYFYPIELRSLLDHGTLAFPTAPLTLWWMLPFAALTDPIIGAKLGAALGGALIAVPAYGLGTRLGRSREAGLVCALLATTSAGSAYLTIEFVKQGVGLTVAMSALWCALVAFERRTRPRWAIAAAAVVAALVVHKLAATFVVVVLAIAAIEDGRARRNAYLIAALVACAMVLVVLGIIEPKRFASTADLALARDLLTTHAQWWAPALATPRLTLAFNHEALIAGALAVGAAIVLARKLVVHQGATRVVAWSFVALGLVIVLPWLDVGDQQGLAFRLRVSAFVPMAVCAAIIAGAAPARVRIFAPIVALIVVLAVPRDRHTGEVSAHPALVAAAGVLAEIVPPGVTIIVGERHVEYMIGWYTGAPVSSRPESIAYAARVRVVLAMSPVHAGFSLEPVLDDARTDPSIASPISLHPSHRDGFVLISEPTWDWILQRLSPHVRAHWRAWSTI